MVGQLTINGKDAYQTWGITMDETSLSSLMTPPPIKDFTENKSRTENGKRVSAKNPKLDERSLQLSINITAPDRATFLSRYNSFCQELATGRLNIKTIFTGNTVYKTIYKDCRQFEQFNGRIGKYILSLEEPNPADRS